MVGFIALVVTPAKTNKLEAQRIIDTMRKPLQTAGAKAMTPETDTRHSDSDKGAVVHIVLYLWVGLPKSFSEPVCVRPVLRANRYTCRFGYGASRQTRQCGSLGTHKH